MKTQRKKGSIKRKLLIAIVILLVLSPGVVYTCLCLTGEAPVEPVARVEEPNYSAELDRADRLIYEASSLVAGEVNIEARSANSDKILEATDRALDILDPLSQKYPGKADIEERLQAVYELRHAALKDSNAF